MSFDLLLFTAENKNHMHALLSIPFVLLSAMIIIMLFYLSYDSLQNLNTGTNKKQH